ncbi:MAG: hypothetical protein DRO18_08115 [Thermoprotei archaeon]|nr:MAG: hypothetical protein DRO18_08115 [Thermoprotei archaeon]
MALEDVIGVIEGIIGGFNINTSSLASTLAMVGLIILGILAASYLVMGLIKLGKTIWNMKVKEFVLMMVILGAVFIAIAMIIP